MSRISTEEWLTHLSDQYERYPYPYRDPTAEPNRGTRTIANDLSTIAHFLNGGRPMHGNGFRALVAGGGTGDATVHLARQLATLDPEAEVVHIDLSEPSMEIARQRIDALGLTNVRFELCNLLELTPETFGLFDYINCSGVLHHLPDTQAGLQCLADVLKPEGGVSVMLYGAYGRIGVYQIQDMMRRLSAGQETDIAQVAHKTRALLGALPPSHWQVKRLGGLPDQHSPDAEIIDKYLHPHDRAFTMPGIFELVETTGLAFSGFARPLWYDPDFALPRKSFGPELDAMNWQEKAAFAEILHGAFHDRHIFYASKRTPPPTQPAPDDLAATPVWLGPPIPRDQTRMGLPGPIPTRFAGSEVTLLKAIDGTKTIEQLATALMEQGIFTHWDPFMTTWRRVYQTTHGRGQLMLSATAGE